MRYLLDTHVVLWWFSDPGCLSRKAQHAIGDPGNVIFVSSASFWEMGIKSNLGRLTVPSHLLKLLSREQIDCLPITPEEALPVAELPDCHQDPFDRMLVVQAKMHDLTLITRDRMIPRYPVRTLKA